jgi:hypothetical protein
MSVPDYYEQMRIESYKKLEDEYYEKLQDILERLPNVSFKNKNSTDEKHVNKRIEKAIKQLFIGKSFSKRAVVHIKSIISEIDYLNREYINGDYELLIHLLYLYEDILNIIDQSRNRNISLKNTVKLQRNITPHNVAMHLLTRGKTQRKTRRNIRHN